MKGKIILDPGTKGLSLIHFFPISPIPPFPLSPCIICTAAFYSFYKTELASYPSFAKGLLGCRFVKYISTCNTQIFGHKMVHSMCTEMQNSKEHFRMYRKSIDLKLETWVRYWTRTKNILLAQWSHDRA